MDLKIFQLKRFLQVVTEDNIQGNFCCSCHHTSKKAVVQMSLYPWNDPKVVPQLNLAFQQHLSHSMCITLKKSHLCLLFSFWMNDLPSCVFHKQCIFNMHTHTEHLTVGDWKGFFFNLRLIILEEQWSWHWCCLLSAMQGMPINVTGSCSHRTNGEQVPPLKYWWASKFHTVLVPNQILNSN